MQTNLNGFIKLTKKVTLKPYQPRQFIGREYLTDAEIVTFTNYPAFVDVECYPNFFLITFKINGRFLSLECGQDRSFNPKMLSWIMNSYKTIGFNSIKYDLLMIWLSYNIQDTRVLKDASNDIIIREMRKQDLQKEYQFFSPKTSHVDLIEVAPLKGSLKLYMARLHAPRIQELPYPDTQELSEEEIEIVKQYNFNDLDGTELLYNFMKERLELREAMSIEYNEDLMSKSDAQIAEVILAKEVGKLNGKRPQRTTIENGTVYHYVIPDYIQYQTPALLKLLEQLRVAKFIVQPSGKIAIPEELKTSIQINKGIYRLGIGGLHSSEESISYKATEDMAIVDRDVASYYPRLITTLKLFPVSCGPNFLTAFNKIIDIRLDAKKKKIFARDKGLKIVINGTSGKLSDVWSIFYAPDLTIQMTVSGQLALLMFIEWLELSGIQVISANTDGIVMLVTKDKEETLKQTVAHWEKTTGFETEETRYKSYHARDVNAYFAVKMDGSIKVKGNPYSEVGSQSGTQLDVNPSILICSDAIQSFLSSGKPIEETILECRNFTRFVNVRQAKSPGAHKSGEYLGKVIRWYYAKGETGSINTVATNNKVADSDGAKPAMDLPKDWPDDLNYQWYIDKANEILHDIGYFIKPKQLEFF